VRSAPYIDTEAAVVALLADFTPGTRTPVDLRDRLPYVRIYRIGGTDDGVTDAAQVAIDVFGVTRAEAWQVARTVQATMLDRPHATSAGVVDRVRTATGPTEAPYTDTTIRLVTATYEVQTRRR